MIIGFNTIEAGEILVDGKVINNIPTNRRNMGMVFQNYAVFPHMSVRDNVAYGLKTRKVPKAERYRQADEILKMVKIDQYADRMPAQLSGGQQQRVALARAIVIHPEVLLMDEPLSNLDAKLRNQMRAEIIKLRSRINTTFIYVTHDQTEAMTLGDRIVIMRDGFIQQIGTPQDVFNHPLNLFVSGFIGSPQMNYFDGELVKKNGEYVVKVGGIEVVPDEEKQARLKKNDVAEQTVTVGVRPEHMTTADEGIPARVDVSEMMGSSVHLHVTAEGKDVIIIVPTIDLKKHFAMGDNIHLRFGGNVVHLFSKETEQNLEW